MPGDIEDATQEVFVELWLNAGRFDPEKGSEPAFVATLAHRRLIDYQRRTTVRLRHVTVEAKPESPARLRDAVSTEDVSRVAEAFDLLPDQERRALWLSIYGGMTHRQIGIAMDSPIGTVKTRLRKALSRLHEALAGGAA